MNVQKLFFFFCRSHYLLTIREHTWEKPYKYNKCGKSLYKQPYMHFMRSTQKRNPINVLSVANPSAVSHPNYTLGISYREETLRL